MLEFAASSEQFLFPSDEGIGKKPAVKEVGPSAHVSGIGFAYAEAVSYSGKDVQFSRHAGALHLQVKLRQPFGDILAIVGAAGEKGRRRFLREMQVVRNCRIEKRLKCRSGTLAIDGVTGRRVSGVVAC